MAKNNVFEIEHYFVLWQDGRLSKTDNHVLQEWLEAAPENRQAWDELASLWKTVESADIRTGSTPSQQWLRLRASLPQTGRAPAKTTRNTPNRFAVSAFLRSWRFAVVAAVTLLFALNSGDLFYGSAWQTVTAPTGKISKIQLADGSSVELNAESSLSYPKTFEPNSRLVELAGEAFFQVAKSDLPFVVKTSEAEITVTGTSFNVRTWGDVTAVFVKTGSVDVRSRAGQAAGTLSLSAGEMAMTSVDGSIQKSSGSESVLAWRTGGLAFDAASLADVLSELQRRFGVSVRADSGLLNEKITAHFQQESLSEILSTLAAVTQADVREVNDGYILQNKK